MTATLTQPRPVAMHELTRRPASPLAIPASAAGPAPPDDDSPLPLKPKAVLGLLLRQRDLYRQLATLSESQHELIGRGRTDLLLSVLSRRRKLVEAVGRTHAQLLPHLRELEAMPFTPQQRLEARAAVAEVQATLRNLIDRDEQDREALEAAKGKVGRELALLRESGSAASAYRAVKGLSGAGGAWGSGGRASRPGPEVC